MYVHISRRMRGTITPRVNWPIHCSKNNLNLRIKTEPVPVGVFVWFLGRTYHVVLYVSAPFVTSRVFVCGDSDYFWGQCISYLCNMLKV